MNAYFMRNLRARSKITSQLYIWHSNTNFSQYLVPFPDFDELAADIPMYRRHGVVGLFLQGAYPKGGGGENAELRSYVMARLLRDTRADAEAAVTEFLEGVYGKAAPMMRDYLELMHPQVREPPRGAGRHLWIFGMPDYAPEFPDQARALLERALAAAEDEAVRHRVRKAALSIDDLDFVRAKEFRLAGSVYAPADLAALRRRFESLAAELRRFGITSIREGVELASEQEEFRRRPSETPRAFYGFRGEPSTGASG
jgi:hypothetical protein